MRKLIFSLLLCGTLSTSSIYSAQEQEDINLMFERLNNFYIQYQEQLLNLPEGTQLSATTQEEFNELVTWYGLFLIVVCRLHQQAACMTEQVQAQNQISMIWSIMHPIFTLLDTTIQTQAIEQALMWINLHAQDAWTPEEPLEYYVPQEQWASARTDAAEKFVDFLYQLQRTSIIAQA